jgi:hypothetical protein
MRRRKSAMRLLGGLVSIVLLAAVCATGQESSPEVGSFDASSTGQPAKIDPLSGHSLLVFQVTKDQIIGMATGFPVLSNGRHYLITNWHVVSGRAPKTNQIRDSAGRTPDSLAIVRHATVLGRWVQKKESLFENGKRQWLEHPTGQSVDVVALPLAKVTPDIQIFPLDLSLGDVDMIPEVGMDVVIVGFPAGIAGPGRLPIWKTGHIASEPALDFGGEPVFLIDATTRGGMSGSPVYLRLWGNYRTQSGNIVMSTARPAVRLLGVYSAQSSAAELGKVWRPRVIGEIFAKSQ